LDSYAYTVKMDPSLSQEGEDNVYLTFRWDIPNGTVAGPQGYIGAYVTVNDKQGNNDGRFVVRCSALDGSYYGYPLANFAYPVTSAPEYSTFRLIASAYVISDDGGEIFPPVPGPDGSFWLKHNLGADYVRVGNPNFNPDAVPTSRQDEHAYGFLWQWGRKADGHQIVTYDTPYHGTAASGVTDAKANDPVNSLFITSSSDWRVNSNDLLWRDINTPNQVCPKNWRLGTDAEWNSIRGADGPTGNGFFNAPNFLFLSLAGRRINSNGAVAGQGVAFTNYWTSTVRNGVAQTMTLGDTVNIPDSSFQGKVKAFGGPVRCRYGKQVTTR